MFSSKTLYSNEFCVNRTKLPFTSWILVKSKSYLHFSVPHWIYQSLKPDDFLFQSQLSTVCYLLLRLWISIILSLSLSLSLSSVSPSSSCLHLLSRLPISPAIYISLNNFLQKAVPTHDVTNPASLPPYYLIQVILFILDSIQCFIFQRTFPTDFHTLSKIWKFCYLSIQHFYVIRKINRTNGSFFPIQNLISFPLKCLCFLLFAR